MKTKITTLLLMVAALAVAGCSSPATRIKHNPELFASISAPEQELIKQGRIGIGFTPDMVKLALGEPGDIARRIDKTGTSETWRYRGYDSSHDHGFHGYYDYYGWGGPYRHRGYHVRRSYWHGFAPTSDYLRVTIKEGRVVEINQLQ